MFKTAKSASLANAITHAGSFHADEVFATVILSKLFDINLCRTFKVPEEIEGVIVYDIGYGKYDHHQKGGNGVRDNGVPYAAAGLIWKEFGPMVVADTCNPRFIWEIIDRDLIQGVDAIDNGATPKSDYPAKLMSISAAIASFNPNWDNSNDVDIAFEEAVEFAEVVFDNLLANAIAKAKAKALVDEAINYSKDHIMVLDRYLPWQEFVFASENEKANEILFVVYPSNRGGYNWHCVPDSLGSFGQKKPVPDEWKGLSGPELQKVTGIETASFCNPAGFIGGAATFEDALALAKLAVEA